MVQRSMNDALREALAALHSGRFDVARDQAAPWMAHPSGALLHALGRAGAGGGRGDVGGAAAAMAEIAAANPAARHPVHDLVELLQRHGAGHQAACHLRAALRHRPDDPALHALLGAALAENGPIDGAIDAFGRAATLAPGNAQAWSNLGKALAAAGRFDAAWPAFANAARLAPRDGQLRLNQAVALLKAGRWAEGWTLFRERHGMAGRAPAPPGPELTALDGVAGRIILLVHEEGFGDTLQFIRYAPLLMERGAAVLAWVPAALAGVLRSVPGLQTGTSRPSRYDAWCRIPDLPALFRSTPDDVPAALPYLQAEPALVAAWAGRLPPGRRVGLVWSGAARLHDAGAVATDRVRSIPAGRLGPLLAAPGVTFISLQHGTEPPTGVWDAMRSVRDFADTAAIIMSLERVVSVDTAVAHLAAALGKPVLLLDRYDNCWRWLSERADSPWYPGLMEIIRQPAPGDWESVLHEAVVRLGAA